MVAEQLWTWLNGDYSRLTKDYSVAHPAADTLVVTPLSNETADVITSISIIFDKDSRQPKEVLITEPDADTTHIAFMDHILNPSLPPPTFTQCYSSD